MLIFLYICYAKKIAMVNIHTLNQYFNYFLLTKSTYLRFFIVFLPNQWTRMQNYSLYFVIKYDLLDLKEIHN